ncbi:MAG: hypothetical protein GF329_20780 [Candidatus Lokiarchaeota archaeon]|nr:hypothetical protein [Candidatus Lokiarchaeota archaeon]
MNMNPQFGYKILDKSQIINKIRKELMKYNPIIIILHGSVVKTSIIKKSSDIDFIVVSDIYKNVNFFTRIKFVQNLLRKFKPLRIDVICLTYSEFDYLLSKKMELFYSLQKGYQIVYRDEKK